MEWTRWHQKNWTSWGTGNRILSTITSGMLAFGISSASADDTEIFFGRALTQPNVVFVVDTSGSMKEWDGVGSSRLDRVKEGLKGLLNTTNNINAGLMRYGNGQIKVLQPVAPVHLQRDNLIAEIDGLAHDGGTPSVPAIYEAALYLQGGTPRYNCDTTTGDNPVCIEGPPDTFTYNSPMISECQSNHIVLVTDGHPNSNNVVGTLNDDLGLTCLAVPTEHDANGGTCGAELAAYLSQNDNSATLPDDNTITTHTIGFNISLPWLKQVSDAAGGGNYEASSANDLIEAINTIIEVASDGENTFVAPAVTLDQFSRLSHREDIYVALFNPAGSTRWSGNLKKYMFTGSPATIQDQNENDVYDTATGSFVETAQSYWSDSSDGADVARGGAAAEIDSTDRRVYTYITNKDLTSPDNAVHEINDKITASMLNVPASEVSNLLQWARGVDVDDEDNDSATVTRHHMGDPLHSRPAVLTYGGSSDNPESVVFIGTNEGYLHAIDSRNGSEVFSFIPEELLANLDSYYDNEPTINRLYGLDGDLTLWTKDSNNDGVISGTGEHAYLYAGMRRGGRNYYALDVSSKNSPKLLWSIKGGTGDFAELGQSWSKPTHAKIMLNNSATDVLIFAGGYDPMQDNSSIRSADTQGNTLFIVNASTGDLIWKTATDTDSESISDYSDMVYSMPSDPRVIDMDGDGFVDQVYVGDMGGQLWRFDITAAATPSKLVSGGMIASLSGNSDSSNRRFFYPPDVSIVAGDTGNFLSVAIGSGNRAHPLDETVDNRFYMIRQSHIYSAPPAYGINVNPNAATPAYRPITETNLFDATESSTVTSNHGWFFKLEGSGEKVLAQSLTIENKIIFTTYLPDSGHTDICTPAAGGGRVYTVSVFDASPVGGGSRWEELERPGIPPAPVAVFSPDGTVTVLVGPESVFTLSVNLTKRVYWTEQPDF